MTFTVSRTALHDELQLLTTVVAVRGVIPVLSCVMLGCDGEHLMLTATDLDATLITEIPAQGSPWGGCVPAHQLAALVKLLDGDELILTPQKTRLEVRCGASKHLLLVISITEFPELEQGSGDVITLSAELLREMVKATSFAMLQPHDSMKPADFRFTGLSIRAANDKLEVMATKKTVTAIAEASFESHVDFSIVIPPAAVRGLLPLLEGETVALTGGNHAKFTCGQRTLIARTFLDPFPDWRSFLPEYKYTISADKAALSAGLKRTMVTMGVDNAVGYEPLRLTFDKQQVTIESRGGDRGQSLEPVAITSNLNGEPLAIGVFGAQVLSVLRGETVDLALASPDMPILFRVINEKFQLSYIVMPTSLKIWS